MSERMLRPSRRAGWAAVVAVAASLATGPTGGAGSASVSVRGSWPVYGANLANSRTSIDGPARSGVTRLRRAWTFDCRCGDFTGTPIVGGGRVVAASDSGRVVALDEATGRVIWSAGVGGPVNSSAAYDAVDGRLFVAVATVGAPSVVALDPASGGVLWRRVLTTQPGSDEYASPQLLDGDVIIGTSALFAETSQSKPSVHGTVSRVDGASGRIVWQTDTVSAGHTGAGVWATAAVDLGTSTVYVGTGNAYVPPADPHTDSVLAIDAGTGRILHAFQATPNDVWDSASRPTGPDYDFGASPNLFRLGDGTPAVGEGQKSGMYWTLRRSDLSPVWHTRVAPGSALGGVLGSTATDGSRVYGPASEPAEVWSLRDDGRVAWLEPSPEPLKWSPVSISNGVMYAVSTAALLQAWDAASGAPLAAVPLGMPAVGGVSIADGSLFTETGTSEGTGGAVIAFDVPPSPSG